LNLNVPGQAPTSFLNYDVISFNGLIAPTGNVQGRVAVKNNIVVGNGWSVGSATGNSPSDAHLAYALIVGNNASWASGEVYPNQATRPNGPPTENIFVGNTFTGADYLAARVTGNCSTPNCLASQFDDVRTCYAGYQASLANHIDNVQKVIQWSGLTITCDNAAARDYYVTIHPSEFNQFTYITTSNCNSGARWTVNVDGTSDVTLSGVALPGQPGSVVYNIQGSGRTINVNNIQVQGSILSPFNTLYQKGGNIIGKVIVGDISLSLNFDKGGCFVPTGSNPPSPPTPQ